MILHPILCRKAARKTRQTFVWTFACRISKFIGMSSHNPKPQPLDFSTTPRFAGVSGFMRLPLFENAQGLDIALFGIPWDGGTTNRPGARHGPRDIRAQSVMIRPVHQDGTEPFSLCAVGDVGDAPVNPLDLSATLKTIEEFADDLVKKGAHPLSAGGDHLSTLPVLRALSKKYGPLGLVHVDAHSDTSDLYFGASPYTHGSVFRRAVEEKLIDPTKTVQIGLRGSINSLDEYDFARSSGMTLVPMHKLGETEIGSLTKEVLGDTPTFISFDIDALDPAFAPGTGTPEVGGMTTLEAQLLLRSLSGVNAIGADVVEVSPPFDHAGITSLAAANIMFEILCLMAKNLGKD